MILVMTPSLPRVQFLSEHLSSRHARPLIFLLWVYSGAEGALESLKLQLGD